MMGGMGKAFSGLPKQEGQPDVGRRCSIGSGS